MICPSCGKELSKYAQRCDGCGYIIGVPTAGEFRTAPRATNRERYINAMTSIIKSLDIDPDTINTVCRCIEKYTHERPSTKTVKDLEKELKSIKEETK